MTNIHVLIAGMGLVTPLGKGVDLNWRALLNGKTGMGELTLFPTADDLAFPVGEVKECFSSDGTPRTHRLALMAAKEAVLHTDGPPDAIVMGCITGGMSRTEALLKTWKSDPSLFSRHGAGSVAEYLARKLNCKGPVITVSTACSSGATAIALALALLKTGKFKKILAGGAESLCRLTYFGFHSLQLIDPKGSHPLDRDRKGLTVSEGAGMLLLEGKTGKIDPDAVEILSAGLTCDAFHPASPDPEGAGAFFAMAGALKDGGLNPWDIDYVNLHGTGTLDNDVSEANAFNRLFETEKPLVSSVKGAFGHSLSAAGAIEAVVSAKCIQAGIAPASAGCLTLDPQLKMNPLKEPTRAPIRTVLSNAFGFGGSNASLVIGRSRNAQTPSSLLPAKLEVAGTSCITGAGNTTQTLGAFLNGLSCRGLLSDKEISQALSSRAIRRLKRLSRMGLSLATTAFENAHKDDKPNSVFFGTGWGALSETHDFLKALYETGERFSSPTDFMGSVHNATAGRIAINFEAKGPNITTTGGDYSFEQALMSAQLLAKNDDRPLLIMGADEFHPVLSRLFDGSVAQADTPSDGGGALMVRSAGAGSGPRLEHLFYENAHENDPVVPSLVLSLGGNPKIDLDFGAVLVGLPAASRNIGQEQLDEFIQTSGFIGPVIDYRRYVGEFASASAVAAVLAVALLKTGKIPGALTEKGSVDLRGRGILLLGLGHFITAAAVHPGEVLP
ncbi:MAG: beta-ketoacyl-[acyl-carrier-protein] synthase family protein [Deltaproteobacteria bacterium]|nr:beta-ketoacyl-[acyl-carrier-protein] synthase family protein [Deltaproteobacteria bacterium]